MSPRRKVQPSLLDGKKATVCLERNGLSIRVDDVDAASAGLVAADLLEVYRALRARYPELTDVLPPVDGGHPVFVTDNDWAEDGRHRVGFRRRP